MQAVQGLLKELFRYADSSTNQAGDSLAVASDLASTLDETNEAARGMSSSLLFESPESLLNFLLKTTQVKDLAKTKEEILELIVSYIKRVGPKGIQSYALSIIDTCFSVFRAEITSKVKLLCLPPIIDLIQMKLSTLNAESLKVQQKVDALLLELSYGKNTQTVKGQILETLGVFAEYFPQHLASQSRSLLSMLFDLLNTEFMDKNPDMKVIEGAMIGLSSLLVNFSSELTSDAKKVATLWKFTFFALNIPERTKRYAVPISGMLMIQKHASILKQFLTEKASQVYPLLKSYCIHSNTSLRKKGFVAMESFLHQVSLEIMSEDRSKEANSNTLRYFFEDFWSGLQERNNGLMECSIFVRGLGIFARSINFYMGSTEVKQMLLKLMVFSDRFFSPRPTSTAGSPSSEEYYSPIDSEEMIEHMPAIINAFGNIIMELPDIDDSCTDTLERVIGSFFLVYPQLYEYQRTTNYKALNLLLVSLHHKGASLQSLLSSIVFKGLTLTCSKPINNPNNQYPNNIFSNISTDYFFEYQDLWKNLLNLKKIPELELEDDVYESLSSAIYDELMQSILKMLKKLDLRYSVVKESDLALPFNPPIHVATLSDAQSSVSLSAPSSAPSSQSSQSISQEDATPPSSPSTKSAQRKHQSPSTSFSSSAKLSVHTTSTSSGNTTNAIDLDSPSSGSLPSSFGTSMDIDSSQGLPSTSLSQSSITRKTKPVADIQKDEFTGCARFMMPNETLRPWVPKDFELFLHLVEFVKLFLPNNKPFYFVSWAYLYFKELITKSNDYPLISGIYNLVAVGFHVCSYTKIFHNVGSRGTLKVKSGENMEIDEAHVMASTASGKPGADIQTRRICFRVTNKFVREVLNRLKQYRDELLASCLQAVLATPVELLDIPTFTPCLVRAFNMGLGFLPLTEIGLTALEKWMKEQPEELKTELHKILPSLGAYLYISKDEVETNLAENERFNASDKNSTSSWVFGTRDGKPKKGGDLTKTANEYRLEHSLSLQANLQIRILRILGILSGDKAKILSETEAPVSWDTTKRVFLTLGYNGGHLKLCMDEMIPVLCKLAHSASNRQTKISACEIIHALCLNLTNQDSGQGELEEIYRHLFPIIVTLATDVEKITRQLFVPLTSHLIKWSVLTGIDKSAQVLLTTITDSLASESDGALRTFAASTLTEFLKIYMDLRRNRKYIVSLFSLLHSMAGHTNPYKRLGAVLAFQQLATVMHQYRQSANFDHSVIQLLEICNSLFTALQLTTAEQDSIGIRPLAVSVIESYSGLIHHFSKMLYHFGIGIFVSNLFNEYCGHTSKAVRDAAQALFSKLVSQLPGNPSSSLWLKSHLTGSGSIYESFEKLKASSSSMEFSAIPNKGTLQSQSQNMDSPSAPSSSSRFGGVDDSMFLSFELKRKVSLDVFEHQEMQGLLETAIERKESSCLSDTECLAWFARLSSWIDSINWLVCCNTIESSSVCNTDSTSAIARIFPHIKLYLSNYALMDLHSGIFVSMTPQEVEKHTQARCSVTLSLFRLAISLMDRGNVFINTYAPTIYRVLIVSMLAPDILGFPVDNAQEYRRVRRNTSKLLTSIKGLHSYQHPSKVDIQSTIKKFNSTISSLVNHAELDIGKLEFIAGKLNVEKMKYIASGLYDLNQHGLLQSKYSNLEQLGPTLLQRISEIHNDCNPMELVALRKVIKLILTLPFEVDLLFGHLKVSTPATKHGKTQVSSSHPSSKDQTKMDIDTAKLEIKSSGRVITMGESFYINFKVQIDDFFTKNATSILLPLMQLVARTHSQLFKMILSILNHQISDKKQGKKWKDIVPVLDAAFEQNLFSSWIAPDATTIQREYILDFIKKLLQIDACKILANANCRNFIVRSIDNFMAKEQPLWFKNRALSLLPMLLHYLKDDSKSEVIKAIGKMIVFDYPSNSSSLKMESAAFADYSASIEQLLHTLSTSRSPDLLECLFPILNEAKHVHIVKIDQALDGFVKRLSTNLEASLSVFDLCFKTFLDQSSNIETLRLALLRKICIPLLCASKEDFATQLIKGYASTIFGIIYQVLPEIANPKPDSKPPIIDRATIISRIGSFHLVQAIFQVLSNSDREALNNTIHTPKEVKSGSLSQKVMRCAFAVRNKKHAEMGLDVPDDIFLDYQCTAYHALATVLMKAQPSNEKFFQVFGFKEDPEKGDMLWENIVDLHQNFSFPVETNFPIASKQVTAIFSKASQKKLETGYSNMSQGMAGGKQRFIASNYFADSSLNQDVANSSFFTSIDANSADENEAEQDNSKMEIDLEETRSSPQSDLNDFPSSGVNTSNSNEHTSSSPNSNKAQYVPSEIELDPLNSNPCMLDMMDMIDDMSTKFPSSQEDVMVEMPKWMVEVFHKFSNPSTHLNIKLFISKLIMNKLESFEKYASHWFTPLCNLLLNNIATVGNPGFNYYVRDLCLVFLQWSSFVPREVEQKRLAGQFFEYLMRNAVHPSLSVTTSNLQIVRLLLERWNDSLLNQLPRKLLYEMFSNDRKSSRATKYYKLFAIQVLGTIVGHQYGLWNDANFPVQADQISKAAFLQGLVSLLSNSSKPVYLAVSDVIGLAFSFKSNGADDYLKKAVLDRLTLFFNQDDYLPFISILDRISKHYPDIVDPFASRILTFLKKMGDMKSKALAIVSLRIGSIEDPFALLVPHLDYLLRHKDETTQLVTLNLLASIHPIIGEKDIASLIPVLSSSFVDHASEQVRSSYTQLLISIYEIHEEVRELEQLKVALLKGLSDPSEEVATTLYDFWDQQERLSNIPHARLQQLLGSFYHPDIQGQWLRMSTRLMLRTFQVHNSFNNAISSQPPGTELPSFKIDENTAMVGIMEPTAATYVKQSLEGTDSVSMDISPIKNTSKTKTYATNYHTLYFDTVAPTMPQLPPTSPPQAKDGQLSAKKIGIAASTTVPPIASPLSPNSLMPPPKTPPKKIPRNNDFMILQSPPSTFMESLDPELSNASKVRITRRFVNSPSAQMKSSHFFRQKQLADRKRQEAHAREITRKRLHNVQLFRQYNTATKTISNKDIIDPLSSVASKDDVISRMILVSLVNSLIDQIDSSILQASIGDLLESCLADTHHRSDALIPSKQSQIASSISTPFVHCLLRMAHDHPSIIIPSRLVADCSLKSLNYHLGIITLEKQISKYKSLAGASAHTKASKSRRVKAHSGDLSNANSLVMSQSIEFNPMSVSLINDAWSHLVRLYKTLDEEDILRGLYEKPSLTSNVSIKMALDSELGGDYQAAALAYRTVLENFENKIEWAIKAESEATASSFPSNPSSKSSKSRKEPASVSMRMDLDGESAGTEFATITDNELDMCIAGYMNCMSKLCKWDQISNLIYNEMKAESLDSETSMMTDGALTNLTIQRHHFSKSFQGVAEFSFETGSDPIKALWNPVNQEKYMRYFLTSCLYEKSTWNFLIFWIDKNPDKHPSLEGDYSPELAYFSAIRNDLGKTDSYIHQSYRRFLANWSVLPPSMATAAQKRLLKQLQPLIELEEFLNFSTNPANIMSTKGMNQILSDWKLRFPSNHLDDFESWEQVCKHRIQYLNLMLVHYITHKERIEAENAGKSEPIDTSVIDIQQIKKVLLLHRDTLFVKLAVAARKQQRFSVSDDFLRVLENKLAPGKSVTFKLFHARMKTNLCTLRHSMGIDKISSSGTKITITSGNLSKYAEIWTSIISRKTETDPQDVEKLIKLSSLQSRIVLDILDLKATNLASFQSAWNELSSTTQRSLDFVLKEKLREVGIQSFQVLDNQSSSNHPALAKNQHKFSVFCDQVALLKSTPMAEKIKFQSLSIKACFEAIKLEHPAAIGAIPRLLRILSSVRKTSMAAFGKSESTLPIIHHSKEVKQLGALFVEYSKIVPTWIWIRWLNQLVALLSHPEFAYVLPILEQIASVYPQSLYYHFRISTDIDYGLAPVPEYLKKLDHLLRNDLLDKFVLAMENMTNPEHRAKSWISALKSSLHDKELLNKVYWAMVKDCMLVTSDTGILNRIFAKKLATSEFVSRGGEGMPPVDNSFLDNVNKRFMEVSKDFTTNESDKANTLAHYSMWLDSYSLHIGSSKSIEVPGQYSGLTKPQPDLHVKISSFDKNLLIMTSMRRPKRLKIRGTDEKEYWFLTKGGEDLRQDQRIEQFFEVSNHLLKLNVETSKRHLSIHTYQVIPMTTRAGILEWIRDTQPFKSLIDAGNHDGIKKATDYHKTWLQHYKPPGSSADITELYKICFKKASYEDVEKKLDMQHEMIPPNLLRDKIFALSADPESFIGIRRKASTSIAVFSIVSYIIGIGDRHLDNFLINMKDGEFIGIDFGYAFDAASLLLPIPEMVPFRLTRQMVNLLQPLDAEGLLKLTMIHTLNALYEGKQLLLDSMELFQNESLLDWANWCNRLPGKPSIEDYTQDRLQTVREKLSLRDPGFITGSILRGSVHYKADYLEHLVKIVMPPANAHNCTSIKHQVERLIEQSTNPHLLGMAWIGWCPWV